MVSKATPSPAHACNFPAHPLVLITQAFCVAKSSVHICSECLYGFRAPFRLELDGLTWLGDSGICGLQCLSMLPAVSTPASSQEAREDLIHCVLMRDTGAILQVVFLIFGSRGLRSNRILYCLSKFKFVLWLTQPL